jgi:hypothetical protein
MAILTDLEKQALERRRITEMQSKNLPIVGQLDAQGNRIGLLSALFGARPAINQGIVDPNVSVNDPLLFNIYPQIRGSQNVGRSGLISDANAGSSMPVMQPAMQTNTQIPIEQPKSSNIFGDVLGTVFPGIDQSNKQLINAAILRGSLELLKPRQAGENFASQAARALEAGLKTAEIFSPPIGYRTGQEALAAGEAALGKDAKISVFQRSDGTFGYQGTTAKDNNALPNTIDSILEDLEKNQVTEEMPTITTKEDYDKLPSGSQYYTVDSEGNLQLSTKP